MRTDTERIDWLEKACDDAAKRGERAVVVLCAWYSKPGGPDGYAIEVGSLEESGAEWPSLREAIDSEMETRAIMEVGSA